MAVRFDTVSPTTILAVFAGLVLLGMVLEEVFRRTGIPDVLILLVIGLVASVAGAFHVSDLHGLDKVFTTAALVLILFEGATRIRLDELKSALGPSLLITFVTFSSTIIVVGLLATVLFGMRLPAGMLLGAIIGGTSSAVVIPMVQGLPVAARTRIVLVLESAMSDVLCIVAALVLIGALGSKGADPGKVAVNLVRGLLGALAVGGASGWVWAWGLREIRRRRASTLVLGAAVFLVFALAELLQTYGAIAVLVFGVVLGNAESIAGKRPVAQSLGLAEGEKIFLGESAFFLKVLFFVYLGAALKLDGYEPFVFGGLVTLVVFALRPLAVRVSLRPKTTSRDDAVVASALVPKGLAAAVLASLPAQKGIAEGHRIENIVFGCVLFTISLSAVLVLFRKRAFIARTVNRVFSAYPLQTPVPAAAPPAAGEAPPAEDAPAEGAPADEAPADEAPADEAAAAEEAAPPAEEPQPALAEAPTPSPEPDAVPAETTGKGAPDPK